MVMFQFDTHHVLTRWNESKQNVSVGYWNLYELIVCWTLMSPDWSGFVVFCQRYIHCRHISADKVLCHYVAPLGQSVHLSNSLQVFKRSVKCSFQVQQRLQNSRFYCTTRKPSRLWSNCYAAGGIIVFYQ